MVIKKNIVNNIVLLLFKDFSTIHTVTSLARELKMSRVGMWKLLKKLQSEQFVTLNPIGLGKTSTSIVSLNLENILVEKSLALYLTEESINQRRWTFNFADLKGKVDFLIIYGSALHSPREFNDIDIIGVVSHKKKFAKIQKTVDKVQRTQSKKIHSINFTEAEFKKELMKRNRAFVDAIKKGVILFGQEKFVQFIKKVQTK